MRIKFKKEWQGHLIGTVADIRPGIAESLVVRGLAEYEQTVTEVHETKVCAAPSRKIKAKV